MVEAHEPLAWIIWGVVALSAGMYPLGLLLGGCPCCGADDGPVEFNRCIRFVNTNTSAPSTSYAAGQSVDMPWHGFSRVVRRPEDLGAIRVVTKYSITGTVDLITVQQPLAPGQTAQAVYRIYYSTIGSDVGTAVQWTITLVGGLPKPPGEGTPPVFGGTSPDAMTATIYADNSSTQEPYRVTIQLPTVTVQPTGAQLLHAVLQVQSTNIPQLEYTAKNNSNNFADANADRYGWIMRPFDPGGGYSFGGASHPAANEWIYDTSLVESFLAGDATVPYNSGTQLSPIDTWGNIPPSTTWTIQVSDPAQFCGKQFCGNGGGLGPSMPWSRAVLADIGAIADTVTVQTAKLPASTSSTSENGTTTTRQNLCYGEDESLQLALRLECNNVGQSQATYRGNHVTCVNTQAAVGYGQPGGYYVNLDGQGIGDPFYPSRSVTARYFYCGDLLWVLENGPCRSSITLPYYNWGQETYTLGGSSAAAWENQHRCAGPVQATDKNGKCHPVEATVSLNENLVISRFSGSGPNTFAGRVLAGDYVLSISGGFGIYGSNCNQQVFAGIAVVSRASPPPGGNDGYWPYDPSPYNHGIGLVRQRQAWCKPWDAGPTLWQTGCAHGWRPERTPFWPGGSCAINLGVTPERGGLPYSNGLELVAGSVQYGEPSSPYANTVSPQTTTIARAGQEVTFTYCCPQRTETKTFPANEERFARKWIVETGNEVGRGASAYVTQPGYDATEARFDIAWLSGGGAIPGLKYFAAFSEVIYGQVNPTEFPEYDWTATTQPSWLVAEKTQSGLLKLTVDGSQPRVFVNGERSSVLSITAGGTTKTWIIRQSQT